MKNLTLTSEQLKRFGAACKTCGATYGEHKAEGFNCPAVPPAKGFRDTSFVPVHPEQKLIDTLRGGSIGLNTVVDFNASRGVRSGQVVEVVPARTLPTYNGLRHIADKRRTPKTRDVESYVVYDVSTPGSARDRLFWPTSVSVNKAAANPAV